MLRSFGFAPEFISLIEKLHDRTTAEFFISGQYSTAMDVKSEIRQGSSFAPLLFILAAKMLALAIEQDTELQGIHIAGTEQSQQHIFRLS